MKKNSKSNIALFYLTLFLFFKVVGLHAIIPHSDEADAQHCEICQVSAAINLIPLLETETTVVTRVANFPLEQNFNEFTKSVVFNSRYLSSSLFTRPPPPLL